MTTYRAVFDGRVVAESDETVVVEGYRYFPPDSVKSTVLQRSWMKSLCYWKGIASYYDLDTGTARERHAAWTYRHPSPFARRIKGYIAFWPGSTTIEEAESTSLRPAMRSAAGGRPALRRRSRRRRRSARW